MTEPASVAFADTLFRVPRTPGITPLQTRGPGGANLLSSWRVVLAAGTVGSFVRDEEEAIIVLDHGAGTLSVEGRRFAVERRSLFGAPATALYLPPGRSLAIEAGTALEAVIISAPAEPGGKVRLMPPDQVKRVTRGRGTWTREVHDIFVANDHPKRLMVGETFNPPGHWSSFPPHKHDGGDGEPYLEEVYVFAIDPPQGFAQQILYTAGGDAVAHVVRDGDAVLIPHGYHPVAAPPGYRVRYLWALAGDERRLALFEDPAHRFINQLGLR